MLRERIPEGSFAMKILLVPALLLVFSLPVAAADNQPGGRGLGFSCDVIDAKCSCVGAKTGADCKAMKKNCDGGVMSCGVDVGKNKPLGCSCTMALSARNKVPTVAPIETKSKTQIQQ
jgi:hypothetical protein